MLLLASRRCVLTLASWLGATHLCIDRASAHPTSVSPSHDAACAFWHWIPVCPQDLVHKLQAAIRAIALGDIHIGGSHLLALALVYGVAHALGPGHGKFVIASYAFANAETVRRAIAVAFMTAVVQAASAIILVFGALFLFGKGIEDANGLAPAVAIASGALMTLLGAYLVWTSLGWALRLWSYPEPRRPSVADRSGATTETRHTDTCACGSPHFAEPTRFAGRWSWRTAAAISLSIGVRPCTGAVLLLMFAHTQNMLWVGVAGVVTMALGTAATLSVLAMAAVGSRDFVLRALMPMPLLARLVLVATMLFAGTALAAVGAAVALVPAAHP
jgi:ABC-type nickel/cobalt efflux system permease component RcnA